MILLSSTLDNLRVFELDSKYPYLVVDSFTDTKSVDTFFSNKASVFLTKDIDKLAALNIFSSKQVLDYFESKLTLIFPNISYLDVLDKDSSIIQLETTKFSIVKTIETNTCHFNTNRKVRFNGGTQYFNTSINTLFNYVNLVYPVNKIGCTKLMLIDNTVKQHQTFYDSANADTLPVLFNKYTLRLELLELIKANNKLTRMCIVATDKCMFKNSKIFINGEPYFKVADFSRNTYSNNVKFMCDLITKYSIKSIDFLACESLTYINWKKYYNLLESKGCKIGASSDKTGNIAYGGDWIMESNNQNIQPVYFTRNILNYQETLVATEYNIFFGYSGTSTSTNIYIPSGTTSYTISSVNIPTGNTVVIYNSLVNTPVTINLASINPTYIYNVLVESIDQSSTQVGQGGNGSNVIIDGSNQTFVIGTDISIFNVTTDGANGKGFIQLNDSNTNALTGIQINNIVFTLDSNTPSIYSDANSGWICGGGSDKGGNNVSFTDCKVISSADINIGYDVSSSDYDSCGGICGGNNNNTLASLGYGITTSGSLQLNVLTTTIVTLYQNTTVSGPNIEPNTIIGSVPGNTYTTTPYVPVTLTLSQIPGTSSTLAARSNILQIDAQGNYVFQDAVIGLAVGQLMNVSIPYTSTNVGNYIITSITNTTSGTLINADGTPISQLTPNVYYITFYDPISIAINTYSFTNCSVETETSISIGTNSKFNGGICGGGNGYQTLDAGIGAGGTYTFTNCYVESTTSSITIGGTSIESNGGICGGNNGAANFVLGTGGTYTFTTCGVDAYTSIDIIGDKTGGICGGSNGNGSTSGEGGTYTFTNCEVISSNSSLNIGSDTNDSYNGGICGGQNGQAIYTRAVGAGSGGTYTFDSCSVESSTTLSIGGGGGSNANGGICGGGNGYGNLTRAGGTYTFTTITLYSSDALSIGGLGNGGICGGGNGLQGSGGTYTFSTCSLVTLTTITITSNSYNAGICGGSNGDIEGVTTGKIYTFSQCCIQSNQSVTCATVYSPNTFYYISNTSVGENIEDNQQLLYGYENSPSSLYCSYPSPLSILLVGENINIFSQTRKSVFAGYNLSGLNLSNINLSNYNLIGTTLTRTKLTGVIYNGSTLITDGASIAANIVQNSGISTVNNTYSLTSSIMTSLGMGALVNGLQQSQQNTSGLASFVSGLFTTLKPPSSTLVIVPALSLPSVNPWLSAPANSTVQFINSSRSIRAPYTKTVALSSITSPTYFYILVQYNPDTVTITSGVNSLTVTAISTQIQEQQNFNCTTIQTGTTTVTQVAAGSTTPIIFLGKQYYIGSVSSKLNQTPNPNPNPNPITPAISNICFPAGTLIMTDQGVIPIEKIIPLVHTICDKTIVHITQTITIDNYLVGFEENSLGKHCPNRKTLMSKDHKIMYKGKMVPASKFMDSIEGIRKVKYNGEILYNILLEEYGTVLVNNLICETLHPDNIIARLYTSNYSEEYKNNIIYIMNDSLIKKDLTSYKNMVNRL